LPDTDILYTFADISRARTLLGYDLKISVQEGVEKLWNWYDREILANR
jgi:nucleoside-diphosphate-sugar epimerase